MNGVLLPLLFTAGMVSGALAHEGHPHKVMGTVTSIDQHQIVLKTVAGKTTSVKISDKTRVVRGATLLKVADIRAGDRAVVTATQTKGENGASVLTATRIQLGASQAAEQKQRAPEK